MILALFLIDFFSPRRVISARTYILGIAVCRWFVILEACGLKGRDIDMYIQLGGKKTHTLV